MRNQTVRDAAAMSAVRAILMAGSPPEMEQAIVMLNQFRAAFPESATQLDRLLAEEITRLRTGLENAGSAQAEIRQLMEALMQPPYFPGVFVTATGDGGRPSALVRSGNEVRAIGFGENSPDSFLPGDEVLLSQERNFIFAKAPTGAFGCGETGSYMRHAGTARVVVKSRDEELVLLAAAQLRDAPMKAGDLIRFDRNMLVAYERLEKPDGEEYFLEETPRESFADIGGLDTEIEEIKRSIELHFYHPQTVRKYRLRRKKSLLLHGPPGTGKTLIARALANWMAELSGGGRSRFINIKPSALHSMWYGQTQANYRDVFRIAREAGSAESDVPIVMFFDEIDSIGGVRGRSAHQIDDSVLNALMAELNGLEERGNILVVGATNRLDALDSALTRPGRLGDMVIRVPRPNRKASRQIFERHLTSDMPYATVAPGATGRSELIETALARIFASNGDSAVAQIMFRDGKRRDVRGRDLINGAEIASMALAAIERACLRESRGVDGGIQTADILAAVDGFMRSAASALTPHNCRNYLDDLPQDVDVVRIDPVAPKVIGSHQYLNAA